MILKKTHTIDVAAAKAGFSRATGYQLAEDPSLLSGKAAPRGWRRPGVVRLAADLQPHLTTGLPCYPGRRTVAASRLPHPNSRIDELSGNGCCRHAVPGL